ncbi:MAG: transporter ATP-binding protein [Paenibacillaceae bacterium]|jgi:ABC-2 type transport system ATP-binding protein|nr:transporter ATP-binding protein [Paenibacillaceae bacterium]
MTTPILIAEDLHKRFGPNAAVNGITFSLQEGSCTSLLGPNGAGKTTALKMLAGLIRPTEGRIRFTGLDASDYRSQIGYLPQYPAFYKWMSALEFMEYAGKLCGMTGKNVRQRSRELLELAGLTDAAKRRIGGFSGGMKQRLGLAQALLHRPSLLILDEPVSALDPIGRREVLELIRGLKQETTILFSTHVLHDAEEISDDVLIMRQGEIVLAGGLEELRRQHSEPVIRMIWDSRPDQWAEGLSERLGGGLVKEVAIQGREVRLEVADIRTVMPKLLADLAKAGAPVRKLEATASSLEELFMKVVEA